MVCAVIRLSDYGVINLIVAEESDASPDGCFLKAVDEKTVDIGWVYDPEADLFHQVESEG